MTDMGTRFLMAHCLHVAPTLAGHSIDWSIAVVRAGEEEAEILALLCAFSQPTSLPGFELLCELEELSNT